jgi:methylase of polypeptide subunit release factors
VNERTQPDENAAATAVTPLFEPRDLDRLRQALAGYRVESVHDLLGPAGQSAHARGDLAGVGRHVRRSDDRPLATLIDLFLLGTDVPEADARAALSPLPLETAHGAGLLEVSAGVVRARLDVRPYAEALPARPGSPSAAAETWWVVSDFGSDVRPGPLAPDHVLGIGSASVTLARATPRVPVGRALDLGTGCGIQALHLGQHARQVVGTDISARALRLAATTAALSDQTWDLRRGSLLSPVAGEQFDLVVANPPFVVSAGTGGYDYRDSGLEGDGVCRELFTGLPSVLAPGGTAQLLANWIIPTDQSWQERLAGWLDGLGCDAWVWQREVVEPGEYVSMWLRDAGEAPGSARWTSLYGAWLDWFAASAVVGIGMGLVTLWRSDAADPVLVMEDVPQAVEQPVGGHLPGWIERQRWLAATPDEQLRTARVRAADGLVRSTDDLLGADGWAPAISRLRQSYGMRWEVEVDDSIASLVAGCDGATPLFAPITVLAASLDVPVAEVADAVLPVVRDLIGRGFLRPEDGL